MSTFKLHRRGFSLGTVESIDIKESAPIDADAPSTAWHDGKAFKLNSIATAQVAVHSAEIVRALALYQAILDGQGLDSLLAEEPYGARIAEQFEALGSAINEGHKQEIETVFFDGVKGSEIVAEDLWIKLSWLSFNDQDNSIRLRFSFGVDFAEDVASDKVRQQYSAELAEKIFKESKVVTKHSGIIDLLKKTLKSTSIEFVERIIYFNAPNGGAYLHHDRERGHSGVVYAQITGKTYWLALPRRELVKQVTQFVNSCDEGKTSWPVSLSSQMQGTLLKLVAHQEKLQDELESFSNNTLIHLINETEAFVQTLISNGYGTFMQPGDVLLLPQISADLCCWHSVFCIDDQAGEALSFAIRAE